MVRVCGMLVNAPILTESDAVTVTGVCLLSWVSYELLK
jgi:hypothetical protein